MRCGLPLFAFAPMMDQPCSSTFQETDAGIVYRLAHDCTLEPGQAVTVTFYWGSASRRWRPPPAPRRCCAKAGSTSYR
ncbi:hypothetical protein M5E87_18330 [Flavonifractor plautii]|nr:hypothetical protein M5E87_18330 [Flavonifractor plautii]